jgi:hypothetical protein
MSLWKSFSLPPRSTKSAHHRLTDSLIVVKERCCGTVRRYDACIPYYVTRICHLLSGTEAITMAVAIIQPQIRGTRPLHAAATVPRQARDRTQIQISSRSALDCFGIDSNPNDLTAIIAVERQLSRLDLDGQIALSEVRMRMSHSASCSLESPMAPCSITSLASDCNSH